MSGDDPYAAPTGARDPARRLRGRLVAPVTVWTATGGDGTPTGITVSSLLVAEGEPPSVLGLVGPVSDFWEAVGESKRFVVHVLGETQRRMADDFAGRNPGPGAPFFERPVEVTEWGPALVDVPTRAYCQLAGFLDAGYGLLVRGDIASVGVPDRVQHPLAYYRGLYTGLRTEG